MFVPVNRPSFDRREVKEVLKTLKTGWVSADSPLNKEFEKNFSKLSHYIQMENVRP